MLNRLRSTVKSLGWPNGLTYILAVLISRLTRGNARLIKYYFVAQPVPPTAPTLAAASGNTRFYQAEMPDAAISQAARPESVIRERFAQGAKCIVAERDGELAGCIWLCPQRYREDEVRCLYTWTPAGCAVWDFDVYITSRWRMSRLFARLWERAHAQLRTEGMRWTLSRIDAFNAGSLAAHSKLGARILGRGWFLVVGHMQLSVLSMAPFIHLALRRDRAPRVCFDLTRLAAPGEAADTPARGATPVGRT